MKRYPKRARPLWGCAKRRAPIRYVHGPTTVRIHGTDNAGNAVEKSVNLDPDAPMFVTLPGVWRSVDRIVATTVKMRADLRIKFTVADPDAPPDPSVYRVTVGAPVADVTIPADAVAVLPPVEVRL